MVCGMIDSGRILVLYGSQTFTAKEVAERIWRMTKVLGFRGPVQAMDEYNISKLIHEEFAIFVCSTTGLGEEPDNMKKFWKFLLRKNLPSNSLKKLKYGVLALGDSSYSKFNFVGKKLHKRLMQLGATPLIDIGLCDYQHDLGHDAVMTPWLKNFFSTMQKYYPQLKTDDLSVTFVPRWKVSLLKDSVGNNGINENIMNKDIYFSNGWKDLSLDCLLLEIEKNVRTTEETYFQDVRLITFKSAENTFINYKPGDIFNIRPRNSKEDIVDLFQIFEMHKIDIKPQYKLLVEESHEDMPVPHFLKTPLTMYDIAEQYWDLRAYPTPYFFSLLALVSDDKLERDKCIELSSPEGQEDWLNYCRRPRRTVLEVLHDFHKSASKLTIEILFELFSSIKCRSFSIASSSLACMGTKLDLLMAVVKYRTNLKKDRLGLASNWLKTLIPGDRVFGWIKKGSLVFPKPTTPHIMVSPGTGLAPFRSLLLERNMQQALSAKNMHLFFGCRYKEKDFHCRNALESLVSQQKLSLYCAFSRDQDKKVYVQHKIKEESELLWRLINDRGAYIYISGNAKNMPDNVKEAFMEIFHETGGLSVEQAKDMLQDLEKNGRLQVEAW